MEKSLDSCFEGLAIDENSYVVIVTWGRLYGKIVLEAYILAEKVLVYSIGRVSQSGLLSEVFNNPVNHEVSSLVNLKKTLPGVSVYLNQFGRCA
jgi:ABC-type sugar transport system ATPase subunit